MPQPGLEPGPSDPESSTLTTGSDYSRLTKSNQQMGFERASGNKKNPCLGAL